ncbi:MAG: isoleucine--tRNA ligase [Patescibacteria group bacterium]
MESRISAREKEILQFWQDKQIFAKTLKKDSPKGDYVFYDGPPFATGTPHYGHIPSSLLKDVVPRFWTMNGYHVLRRWGWDCHGLPVENLIEKELKLETKKDIEEKIGVCGFNEACQLSVLRYAEVWKKFIPRIGRWVDMDDDYKTMDPKYMESIWWVFKTLYDKALIYEGYKSMHICPRCDTTLSNFEVTQNYKEVTDLSVVAKFELIDEPNTFILAWTTTPWTLPGNVALAVGQQIEYVKVQLGKEFYILAKANLDKFFAGKNFKIVGAVDIKNLIGKHYKPLFDYFVNANLENKENIYTIQTADFVTTEDGTGVVHIAPGFGQDDMNLGKEKKLPTILHVDSAGKFTSAVTDWPGQLVKSKDDPQLMDKKIVVYLETKGLLFAAAEFTHSYPFCWRCDTPLLNYSTDSWFVDVTAIKDKLIANNKKVHWTPAHLQQGRFGKWLEGATDWAISRQRYWGTPLPVWKCECGEIKVAGSIEELEKLSGQKVVDLHKHIIDEIKFKCEKCGQKMKRIPDVLDCWFESGSMPYAQVHYPFENKKWFEKNFPAEFIAEGVDQTRGWFYTLMVLATALFNKPAFKNVIVNGIVLAQDGQKMAKRLKNYPEPDLVVETYGADALRYYMLTSPVIEAESLNFSETGVKEVLQKNVMLIGNILSFYLMYKNDTISVPKPKNILDHWILAKLNLLNEEITTQLKDYNVLKAARPISGFINELSTWYLRRSRERFKAGDTSGVNTLGYVLQEFSKLIAPFMPFVAEDIYQKIGGKKESVHLEDWPDLNKKLIDHDLIKQMDLTLQIVQNGLAARAEAGIKIRQPLNSYTTSLANKLPKEIQALIEDELNVKKVLFNINDGLDIELTEELKQEGQLRELIRQINQLRKESGLSINDRIVIYHQGLDQFFSKFGLELKKATLADDIVLGLAEKMIEVQGGKLGIRKLEG